jgi:hypothetical protein
VVAQVGLPSCTAFSRAILQSHSTHTLEGAAFRIKNALYHHAVHIQSITHYLDCLPKHGGFDYMTSVRHRTGSCFTCRGNGCKITDKQTKIDRENVNDG